MGYETKFFVVEQRGPKGFAQIIASYELCKLWYEGPIHRSLEKADIFEGDIYPFGGDEPVKKDFYDEPLKVYKLSSFIDLLEREDKEYRRIQPAINLLRSFDNEKWSDIFVVTYGH